MKILMVCLGNICRSPLAEGILKSKLSTAFTIESAGTLENMDPGKAPDHRAITVAKNHDLDISNQRSRKFVKEDLENYDLIFCMDDQNLKDVQSLVTDQKQLSKIKLMRENSVVPDPFWGKEEDFEKVYRLLDQASEKIANNIKE